MPYFKRQMSDDGVSVTEGKATIYFPTQKGVFYNPPQVPNRDLSVLALQQFSEEYAAERADEARVKACLLYTSPSPRD